MKMQTRFIVICLVVFVSVQMIAADMNSPLQNRRSKRFVDIGGLLKGLRAGASFIDTVNKIFKVDDTDFGRIVSRIAQFDGPRSEEVYDEFETMMASRKDMTDEQTTRAHQLMEALKQNMDNSGSMLAGNFVTGSILALSAVYAAW